MPNSIKESGADGVALQVTKPARSAGLVDENSEGEPTRLAPVRVYAFNNVLLVVDREELSDREVADLVAVIARDTKSVYQGRDGTKAADVIRVDIPDTAPDHYDTPAIRKAVLLARYGTLLRDWLADAATASDDTSPDHEVRNGGPLNSHSPDDRDGGLNQWERQSTPLVVPDTYREQFSVFRDHLAAERDAIADPDLEQELDVLDTLADA